MALKSDAFYQKAIQSLARALAHLNPTPEDKVKWWSAKTTEIAKKTKIIDFLSLKLIFPAPTIISSLPPREFSWSILC